MLLQRAKFVPMTPISPGMGKQRSPGPAAGRASRPPENAAPRDAPIFPGTVGFEIELGVLQAPASTPPSSPTVDGVTGSVERPVR